jgi:anti-sigma B factor antagonist
METTRAVICKHLPERVTAREARAFVREMQPILSSDRPQMVFDLSQVRHIDAAGVDMLLHCMAEVMKRDGDLKLAALSPQAAVVLEMTRTGRLFEVYQTASDAVRSFRVFVPQAMEYQPFRSSYAPATTEQERPIAA